MSRSFQDLKKSSKNSLQSLTEELNKINPKKYDDKDDRFWEPTLDKAGSGSAVIRFLPAKNEEIPFIRIWEHGFKGPTGQWYIEKSLTSINKPDPVYEDNARLYATKTDENVERAKAQKRSVKFISNILVIKDPANPENDGKVFLYRYPKAIFNKWYSLMNPEFEDITPVNPFCPWEGATFRLRIRKKESWRNYDDSAFDPPSPLSKNDAEIEEIYEKTYSLQEFLDPSKYKTYEELKNRYDKVSGYVGRAEPKKEEPKKEDNVKDNDPPFDADPPKTSSVKEKVKAASKKVKSVDVDDDEGDFSLEKFKDLVGDDD